MGISGILPTWMAALVDSVASKTGSGMCLDFTTSGERFGRRDIAARSDV